MIVGPIASGKSTVAAALKAAITERDATAAVSDLDDVVFAQTYTNDEDVWRRGRQVHAELVGTWLRAGVDVVIAHGPIYTPDETATLLAHVGPDVRVIRVLLLVDVDVAFERVTADTTRLFSRHEPFLRSTHARFAELLPELPACDLTFDTAATDEVDIARTISDTIGI